MSHPTTIKAVLQPDTNSEKLIETTLPFPTPTDTDYLVQVKATAPCLLELSWPVIDPHLFPPGCLRVPGTEGAGVVVAPTPPNATLRPGDEVFYRTDAWLGGSLREYTCVPAADIARKPQSLSWTDAAATPLSALTAWQGLFDKGTLDPAALTATGEAAAAARDKNAAQRVLITGAAGGVGSWAVKFAAAAGAGAVVAVVSAGKAAGARSFGATEIVDYTSTKIDAYVKADPEARAVDLIFDCAGQDLGLYWTAIKQGGTFLGVAGGDPAAAKPAGETKELARAEWFLVQLRGSDLAEIGTLVDKHGWKPLVDSVVPFKQFAEAFQKVDHGRTNGKVVITVPE